MQEFLKPQLSWIDIDLVVQFARKRFKSSAVKARQAQDPRSQELQVEPTLVAIRSGLLGMPLEDSMKLDIAVSLTKTIQNAVGLFHQDILGAAASWKSSGSSGGVIDLEGFSPVIKRNIVAEVKMRFNTIKASDEERVWDTIKQAAAMSDGAVGYIFQIIPKHRTPYDLPWSVSNRPEIEQVRCADGVTAYHLVTGHPNALRELLQAMPFITAQLAEDVYGNSDRVANAFNNAVELYLQTIENSLPVSSAHQ